MAVSHSLSIATPTSPARVAGALKDIGADGGLFAVTVTPELVADERRHTEHGT
ncbi:hypothetical protein ABZ901_00455 [Actinacidiphila alni]|uniref:hypothetical protein n=1 Tax=Actinacidiphila alni TaxID=380248 RepID=UPI0033D00D3D